MKTVAKTSNKQLSSTNNEKCIGEIYLKNADDFKEHIQNLCALYKSNDNMTLEEVYEEAVKFDFQWGTKLVNIMEK